ncbi:MAG: sensor histidine kinase, partial [Pseudomonadota bacterium]|nr:sensor histidine kinase [Pseudomonadota bacterium]
VLATAIAGGLSARFEFGERLAAWLRRRESLQMDELPGVLLVLISGLLWFAWRRYRDLSQVLAAHRRAELALAAQLERNRVLHGELLAVQERERRSIARELHDELGQYLGALRFDLHALGHVDRGTTAQQREAMFLRASQTLGHVQATLRDLIRRLRPAALDELGLAAALDQLVSGWRQRLPETRLVLACLDLEPSPPEHVAIAAFRIVQEALTNAARHSRAGLVEVHVRRERATHGTQLAVDVSDDGIGIDPAAVHHGLGLISMDERASALGGTVRWRSAPGDGFAVHAILPLGTSPEDAP